MPAIWKRKFNYNDGETRLCKNCNESFHTYKPVYTCRVCLNKRQKTIEERKRGAYNSKDKYPYSTSNYEAGLRFTRIRQELTKAWKEGREAVDKHYEKQFKEIKENGIMVWIFDRRDAETIQSRKVKTTNRTKKEYPDTRQIEI